jgi:Flp pilus assembly protein TadD
MALVTAGPIAVRTTKGNQMRTNRNKLAMAVTLGLVVLAGCAHRQQAPQSGSTYETRRQIARELVAQGQWQPAFAYVDALHREQPDDADVLVLRATIYRERNLLSEAEADLREATRLAPHLASAHAGLGIVADLHRQPDEAEENLRLAVKLDPRNAAYLNNLGFSLFLHGKIKEAITNYEQAARLAPTSQRTRTNLGFAYAARGDMHRAAREFDMGGTPVEAKVNLGFAYERRGDMANAYALYAEAARLDPRSTRARANLAHAGEVTGQPLSVASDDTAPSTDASPLSPEESAP